MQVVQEVLLAKKKMVHCGRSCFPWEVYRKAAHAFWDDQSDPHIRKGPRSFPDTRDLLQYGNESLLEGLRAFRKKLSENPRDKVFGILGMVSPVTQDVLPVNYSPSVKTVYTDVVDHLISWTGRIDVIRESIHFPLHVNTTGLPTWCPDCTCPCNEASPAYAFIELQINTWQGHMSPTFQGLVVLWGSTHQTMRMAQPKLAGIFMTTGASSRSLRSN